MPRISWVKPGLAQLGAYFRESLALLRLPFPAVREVDEDALACAINDIVGPAPENLLNRIAELILFPGDDLTKQKLPMARSVGALFRSRRFRIDQWRIHFGPSIPTTGWPLFLGSLADLRRRTRRSHFPWTCSRASDVRFGTKSPSIGLTPGREVAPSSRPPLPRSDSVCHACPMPPRIATGRRQISARFASAARLTAAFASRTTGARSRSPRWRCSCRSSRRSSCPRAASTAHIGRPC